MIKKDILFFKVEDAINKLKKNNSLGADQISAEMLQVGGRRLVK